MGGGDCIVRCAPRMTACMTDHGAWDLSARARGVTHGCMVRICVFCMITKWCTTSSCSSSRRTSASLRILTTLELQHLPEMESQPPTLSSDPRQGHMATQLEPSLDPPEATSAPVKSPVLYAKATLVLFLSQDAYKLIPDLGPSHRRAQPNTLFFTELGAEAQGGPLLTSLGLIPDLAQLVEAVGVGWDECPPLSDKGVELLLDYVLRLVLAKEKPLSFVSRLVTDFNLLQFVVEQAEVGASPDVDFRRQHGEPLPYSIHRLLCWMLQHDYLVTDIVGCSTTGPALRVSMATHGDRYH